MTIEFKIGHIDQTFGEYKQQKFIISRDNDSLIYSAMAIDYSGNGIEWHKDIVIQLEIDISSVLGGGRVIKGKDTDYNLNDNDLRFDRDSEDFGGVLPEVMEDFKPLIIESYGAIIPNLNNIQVDLDTRSIRIGWKDIIERYYG